MVPHSTGRAAGGNRDTQNGNPPHAGKSAAPYEQGGLESLPAFQPAVPGQFTVRFVELRMLGQRRAFVDRLLSVLDPP